jgi:hypothetical protein
VGGLLWGQHVKGLFPPAVSSRTEHGVCAAITCCFKCGIPGYFLALQPKAYILYDDVFVKSLETSFGVIPAKEAVSQLAKLRILVFLSSLT